MRSKPARAEADSRLQIDSHDMGGAMLSEMMRWLWRDHPVSVDPNDTNERSFRIGR